mmetsp:Transcript_1663/g.5796  ORF Transcript_1663/g.5796 Transcript_1663/m.5796 type:complete len:183 (-) Transcript_1663:3484-4032(-)
MSRVFNNVQLPAWVMTLRSLESIERDQKCISDGVPVVGGYCFGFCLGSSPETLCVTMFHSSSSVVSEQMFDALAGSASFIITLCLFAHHHHHHHHHHPPLPSATATIIIIILDIIGNCKYYCQTPLLSHNLSISSDPEFLALYHNHQITLFVCFIGERDLFVYCCIRINLQRDRRILLLLFL